MQAIEKLVDDEEECSQLRLELSQYVSQHGMFGNLHANKDRDVMNPIQWCEMYGSASTVLHKWAIKVLSQVVNSSSAERCWSTYSYIHSVKRNSLNENRAESLVYVHYNLRLLTRYCEPIQNNKPIDIKWDANPEEDNLEDGAIALERLQEELLIDDDGGEHSQATPSPQVQMPPPSRSSFPASSRGGHVASRSPLLPPRPVSQTGGQEEESPLVIRSREKKLKFPVARRI